MTRRIRILVVDDEAQVRQDMRDRLGEHPDMQVVGEAPGGAAAVERAADLQPDVIVLDMSGAMLDDAGGDGVAAAIRAARPEPPDPGLASLTAREREVLLGLARGLSNQDIAEELTITERTARTHVSNILAKLKLSSRTQAALLAIQHDLAEP